MNIFLAFFQETAEPVNSLTGVAALDEVIQLTINYAPKILGAIVLLIVAWIVASIVRAISKRGMNALNVDERLSSAGSASGSQVVKTLSDVVYWIVFLCFIPAILGILGLTGILAPIQTMLGNVLGYLPNILGAALIFVLGMLIANIVRQLVTTFLANIGLNDFAERNSVKTDWTKGGLAGLIGTIVYAIILIAVLSAALSTLKIDAISRPIEGVINPILGSIPNIFGAMILLILAYLIAKVIRGLVTDVLTGLGFNKIPNAIGLSNLPTEGERSASTFVGHLAFLAIMFYAVIEAANILKFALLAETVQTIAVIGGKIIGGIIILAIGMYIANIVVNLIRDSGVANANLLGTVARVAILFFVGAMALNRMGVADDIVGTAFTLLLGAVAVAAAIAFGVGGREFAAETIRKMSDSLETNDSPAPPSTPPATDPAE
jgi:hypothetical protein